jgi:hypothetical protein
MAEFVNTGPHSSDAFWQLMKLPRQHDDGVIQVTSKTLLTVACLVVSYYTFSAIHSLLFSPLKNVPGPFLARITHWFEYFMVQRGDSNLEYVRLHKKYGIYYPILTTAHNWLTTGKTLYSRPGRASRTQPLQHKPPERSQDPLRARRKVFQERLLQTCAASRTGSAKYLRHTGQ